VVRLQGIFLDFYGTLVGGDLQAVESVCQAVIDDHELKLTAAEMAVQWGHYYFAGIEALNGHGFRRLEQIERDTLVETVMPLAGRIDPIPYIDTFNEYLARPPLFEEVREVLAAIDLPVCIVSNADERELRAALDHLELTFDHVVTSEAARSYKPDARIFELALERTGLPAEAVIHVGDSLHSDVGGARRLGLRAAWVNRVGRINDIGTEKPDFAWADLRPIISLQK
jgi:2-haloacid dehalogenase/putative hydrolase of the HAD superfamily